MILFMFFLLPSVLSQNKCITNLNTVNNFNIGVDLPWLKTNKSNLTEIPKNFLVNLFLSYLGDSRGKDKYDQDTYICRADIGNGIKIIGKLYYSSGECYIAQKNITKYSLNGHQCFLPTEKYLQYELLINSKRYNLFWSVVDTIGMGYYYEYYFMPSAPVVAQKPSRLNSYKTTYIAHYRCSTNIHMGTIQEIDNLGKTVFHYGLVKADQQVGERLWVLAVANKQL